MEEEKFNIKDLNKNNNLELICRIVGRYYIDNISESHLGNLEYSSLLNHSFPCKGTLLSLLDSKEYFSHDLRIAIIEICNISRVLGEDVPYNLIDGVIPLFLKGSVHFREDFAGFPFIDIRDVKPTCVIRHKQTSCAGKKQGKM